MKKIKKYRNIEMDDFRKYHNSEMTGSERNSFERKLQKDQFSEEAMEGFDSIPSGELERDLSELHKRLESRVGGKKGSTFYRIAASVAVLMIISSVFLVIQRKEIQPEKTTEAPVVFDIAKAEPVYNPDLPKEKKQIIPLPAGSGETTREAKDDNIKAEVMVPSGQDEQVIEDNQQQKQKELIALNEVKNEAEKLEADQAENREEEAEGRASRAAAASQPAAALRSRQGQTSVDSPPLPEGGMEAFNAYIREKAGQARGEKIIIVTAFVVKTDGVPDTIRVLSNPPEKYAARAIKLIRSGPAWKPAVRNGRIVEEEVQVSIELPVR